jgi:hypothetical protein
MEEKKEIAVWGLGSTTSVGEDYRAKCLYSKEMESRTLPIDQLCSHETSSLIGSE